MIESGEGMVKKQTLHTITLCAAFLITSLYLYKTDNDNLFLAYLLILGIVLYYLFSSIEIHYQNSQQKNAFTAKQIDMESILDNFPFITYLKDFSNKRTIGNKQYQDIQFNINSENNIISFQDLEKLDSPFNLNDDDNYVIANNNMLITEKEVLTEKGCLWLEIHKIPVTDINNKTIGIFVIINNITVNKEINAQKETFISALTHDLKTPATAQVVALKHLLKESVGELNSQQKELIEGTLHSCQYMLNMISSIINTYKQETEPEPFILEKFNLSKLIQECNEELSYLIEERHLTIVNSQLIDNPVIMADRRAIKNVIISLLSNIITYTPVNSDIKLIVSNSNDGILFKVQDKKTFIPPKKLERLFDKYISEETKFRQIGTGLGLYMAKKIIKQHNGQIIALSDQLNGTTLGFLIPEAKTKANNHKIALQV